MYAAKQATPVYGAFLEGATASETRPQSELQFELEGMGAAIQALDKHVGDLFVRLHSVTFEPMADKASALAPEMKSPRSEVGCRIRDMTIQISRLRDSVENIASRLAL